MKIQNFFRYLRLEPFETSSAQGRADERYRLALWAIIANGSSKAVGMLVLVLSVSWTVPYLGNERFGIWMTVASFAGMLLFLDLGIGNALTNRVARVAADNDADALGRTISGGLGFLLIISAAVSFLLVQVAAWAPWDTLIKVSDPSLSKETRDAAILFAILFGIGMFVGGLQKIYMGLQRSYQVHLATAAAYMVSLVLLFYAARAQAGIPILLLTTLGIQQLIGLILLWGLRRDGLLPLRGLAAAIREEKGQLLHIGALFLVLQMGGIVQTGADGLIVSSLLGGAHFAIYAVTQRLFQLVAIPLSVINAPLWGAYADAHSRGDGEFIRHTLIRSMSMALGVALIGGTFLTAFSQDLIRIWTGGHIVVPMHFVIVYFFWSVCESLGVCLATALNGCGIVREQVVMCVAIIAIGLPAKIYFVSHYGLPGMVGIYAIIYLGTTILLYGVIFRKSVLNAMFSSGRRGKHAIL